MLRFRRWLLPVLFGPSVGGWALATLFAGFGYRDPKFGDTFQSWILGMLLATLLGAVMSGAFAAADVLLLGTRSRLLPTGTRAWWTAFASVPVLVVVWRLWPVTSGYGFWVVPPVAVALASRLVMSPRAAR